ncbi:MAG: hypothetical protein LBR58_05345 [Propionibacteriaceae bacterium]|jgi:hypothetical protein|nr:hypothetical protein [Propionibacteriaceae bacterium]
MAGLVTILREASRGNVRDSATLVESTFVLFLGVVRSFMVIQLGVVLAFIVGETPVNEAVIAVTLAAMVWSAVFFGMLVRWGRMDEKAVGWGIADVAVAAAAMTCLAYWLPSDWHVGSWKDWSAAYVAVVSACVPIWLRSIPKAISLGVGLTAFYVAVTYPGNAESVLAIINTALNSVAVTVAAAVVAWAGRLMAAISDANRAEAVRLASELQLAEYRFHMHNASGLLARLAANDVPAPIVPTLRAQAAAESNRLRNQLSSPTASSAGMRGVTLGEIINHALAGFGHLPLEANTALGRDAHLTQAQGFAIESALISLLYNVQFHARASEVTVHADCAEGNWEVSVADDGVGFDPATTPEGFGLLHQVRLPCERAGLAVTIESQPGQGTTVTIRGPQSRR